MNVPAFCQRGNPNENKMIATNVVIKNPNLFQNVNEYVNSDIIADTDPRANNATKNVVVHWVISTNSNLVT